MSNTSDTQQQQPIKSKKTLLAALAAGQTFEYELFWAGPFSQWYPSPFKSNGHFYPTAEHYMMAEKARLFNDTDALHHIMKRYATPKEAKAIGRKIRNFDESTWINARYNIVYQGSLGKYSQNDHLKKHLLGTGNRIMVEASPKDSIWGIGLSEEHSNSREPTKWPGQNLLGFILTNVREELRSKG